MAHGIQGCRSQVHGGQSGTVLGPLYQDVSHQTPEQAAPRGYATPFLNPLGGSELCCSESCQEELLTQIPNCYRSCSLSTLGRQENGEFKVILNYRKNLKPAWAIRSWGGVGGG